MSGSGVATVLLGCSEGLVKSKMEDGTREPSRVTMRLLGCHTDQGGLAKGRDVSRAE